MKERDSEYEKENSNGAAGVVTVVRQEEPLVKDFVDSNYWKVDLFPAQSLDDLLAEMNNWKSNAWYNRSYWLQWPPYYKAASISAYLAINLHN